MIAIVSFAALACNRQQNLNGTNSDSLTGESKFNESNLQERVAGGSLVGDSSLLSAIVRLKIKDGAGQSYTCSGTLISKRVVLTAAHCLSVDGEIIRPENVEVFIGQSAQRVSLGKAEKIIIHESYNADNHTNDMTLVVITAPSTASINPINTFVNSSKIKRGTKITGVGFGNTETSSTTAGNLYMNPNIEFTEYSPKTVSILKEKSTSSSDNKIYSWLAVRLEGSNYTGVGFFTTKEWTSPTAVTDLNNIAGVKPSGTCSGDSGGPTLIFLNGKYRLAGVTSFGFSPFNNNCGGTSFYTSVSDFQNWIRAHIAQ